MTRRLRAAPMLVLLAVPLAAQEEERLTVPTVSYSYVSDAGDPIGDGGSGTVTSANGPWRMKRTGLGVDLRFNALQPDQWTMEFCPPDTPAELLAAGSYPGAIRCISATTEPGLDIGHEFSGCNTVTGEFGVVDVLYDYYGWPLRFEAGFEQHCEGAAPALQGTITAALGTVGPTRFAATNLIVLWVNRIFEFTRAGSRVESIPVLLDTNQSPTGLHDSREVVRDGALGPDGRLYLFNGTGIGTGPLDDVQLSVFDTLLGTWEHHPVPGWSVFDNGSDSYRHGFGAVALHDDYVFTSDMLLNGDDRGIVRFDTADGFSVARFATDTSYIDLAIGGSGLLYALRSDKKTVDVFDPGTPTLDVVGAPLVLDNDNNPGTAFNVVVIGVDALGQLFGVRDGADLHRFDATGASQAFLDLPFFVATDLDIEADGTVIIAADNRQLRFTTTALTAPTLVTLPDATAGTAIDRPGLRALHIVSATTGPFLFDDTFESGDLTAWLATPP
ncbi:MAG: hypothetical protein K8H90_06220 [Thermoanaerobaculia bacterium]|nr:hypothetical protein [Thermoanaerobaculia bacterium]